MPGTSTSRSARFDQLRRRYWHRLAATDAPATRVGAAADHLRAALKYAPAEQRGGVADAVVAELTRQAEQILSRHEKRGSR